MNLSEFENTLKEGLQPAAERPQLSSKVSDRIAGRVRRVTLRRRIAFACAAAVLVTATMVVAPAVQAQVRLQRVAGALNNVRSMVMTRESIASDGSRKLLGIISYWQGDWKIEDPDGGVSYFLKGVMYRLDKPTAKFVSETGLDGPFGINRSEVTLSTMLNDIEKWQPDSRIDFSDDEFKGKTVTKVTVRQRNKPFRQVVLADPESDLPLQMREEVQSSGGWRTREVSHFDYQSIPSAGAFQPDFDRYPVVPKATWAKDTVAEHTKAKIATVALRGGRRLVVHTVDVAPDGTVFVSYQAGEKIARWDRGYGTDVRDSLGTEYCFVPLTTNMDKEFIENSKDGKLEVDIYVPVVPQSSWSKREITVSAKVGPNGKLQRRLMATWMNAEGVSTSHRWYYDTSIELKDVVATKRRFDRPTTLKEPGYLPLVAAGEFSTPGKLELMKAYARADHYRETGDAQSESFWLREALRLSETVGQNPASSNAARRLAELE